MLAGITLGVRSHLLPTRHLTRALDGERLTEVRLAENGQIQVVGRPNLPGAWVVDNVTVTSTGAPFTGPASAQYCGGSASPEQCDHWLAGLGLRQELTYHPASQFWPLQLAETGLFLP